MVELRQFLERRGAWLTVVDDVCNQACGVARLEPVVLAVEHENGRAHALPRTGPVLPLCLLIECERTTIVTRVARADDASPDFAELRIARRD